MNEFQFEVRLAAIERRFRIAILSMTCVLFLFGTVAVKAPGTAEAVRTRKLIIVDSAGRERIEMSVAEPVPNSSEPYIELRSVAGGEDGRYNRWGWHVASRDGEADLVGPSLTLRSAHYVLSATAHQSYAEIAINGDRNMANMARLMARTGATSLFVGDAGDACSATLGLSIVDHKCYLAR